MQDDRQFSQSFRSFARRENVPAALTSDEWEQVPSEIRERAFFMARVTDAEILQRFRDEVENVLRGEIDEAGAMARLSVWLDETGYKPAPGDEGTLKDLSSLARLTVVLRTNVSMARGHATWARRQTAIRAFPAQRLIRVEQREEPRDWDARWDEAKSELGDPADIHPSERVALLNSDVWIEISRFRQPYPPFDFGSGMGVEAVGRRDALGLGFDLKPNTDPKQQPVVRSLNEELQATPQVQDPTLRDALGDRLGRFGEWDGDKLVFTDPDGTKPYEVSKLAQVWSKPAPDGFDRLTQRDALAEWDGGVTNDQSQARVLLRRLFDRLQTIRQPVELWRAFVLSAGDAVALVRSLSRRVLMVPPRVAGWDWSDSLTDAFSGVGDVGTGWRVVLRIDAPKRAVDVGPLRPGKPGWVYVGGTELRVIGYTQDPRGRTITINLADDGAPDQG